MSDTLKTRATEITEETSTSANTAARIGGLFEDLVESNRKHPDEAITEVRTASRVPRGLISIRYDDGNFTIWGRGGTPGFRTINMQLAGVDANGDSTLDEWVPGNYGERDKVQYNGKNYICCTDTTDNQPPDYVTDEWDGDTAYSTGDRVIFNGLHYVRLDDSADPNPSPYPSSLEINKAWAPIDIYWREIKPIPCTLLINGSFADNPGSTWMTWAEIQAAHAAGWEIQSHGYYHDNIHNRFWGEDGTSYNIQKDCVRFAEHGIDGPYNYSPPGRSESLVLGRQVAKRWCRSSLGGLGLNGPVVNSYRNMFFQGDMETGDVERILTNLTSEDPQAMVNVKALIDKAADEGGWFQIAFHIWNPGSTPEIVDNYPEMITYAQLKGLEFVTVNQALDIMGAQITTGTRFAANEGGVAIDYANSRNFKLTSDLVLLGNRTNLYDSQAKYGVMIGKDAGLGSKTGKNTIIGYCSGRHAVGNVGNVFIGEYAGGSNQSWSDLTEVAEGYAGDNCVIIGDYAGFEGKGEKTVFMGYYAGRESNVDNVVAIGYQAGYSVSGHTPEAGTFILEHRGVSPDGVNKNPLIKGWFADGAIALGCPATALADAKLLANRFTFYLDEASNKLMVKVCYANGMTYKLGEVALSDPD